MTTILDILQGVPMLLRPSYTSVSSHNDYDKLSKQSILIASVVDILRFNKKAIADFGSSLCFSDASSLLLYIEHMQIA